MSTKKEKWNFENLICKLPHCRCMQQFPCSNHHYSDECFSTNDHSKSEIIEWEKDLSFRFDTWLKLYQRIPTIGEIEEWLLESLRISDECFSTNDHSKSESIEWKEALDSFIKKWVPGSYAHLSDNDENDGERLRTAIQDAITTAVEAREREIAREVSAYYKKEVINSGKHVNAVLSIINHK